MHHHQEGWDQRKWRPYLAWSYIVICLFDFVVAPILNYQFFLKTGATLQLWKPLTMSDGGMFHMAMGAVLGITSWKRGEEKMTRYKTGYSEQMSRTPFVRPDHPVKDDNFERDFTKN